MINATYLHSSYITFTFLQYKHYYWPFFSFMLSNNKFLSSNHSQNNQDLLSFIVWSNYIIHFLQWKQEKIVSPLKTTSSHSTNLNHAIDTDSPLTSPHSFRSIAIKLMSLLLNWMRTKMKSSIWVSNKVLWLLRRRVYTAYIKDE
jgi:hypothetical protein